MKSDASREFANRQAKCNDVATASSTATKRNISLAETKKECVIMKKTLLSQNAFGKINMWGHPDYGYQLQLEKPQDREIHILKEQVSAAKKFISTIKFPNQNLMFENLEKFMAMGVYGVFYINEHTDGTITLKAKRFVPQEVRKEYAKKMQAEKKHYGLVRV